jgi:hypothetical protein
LVVAALPAVAFQGLHGSSEIVAVHVEIDSGGRERLMAEENADGRHASASVNEVGGEPTTEGMWMSTETCQLRKTGHETLHAARRQRMPTEAEKQRALLVNAVTNENRSAFAHIEPEAPKRRRRKWKKSAAPALGSPDKERARVEVEVSDATSGDFAGSWTEPVKKFDERTIAENQGTSQPIEAAPTLRGVERDGKDHLHGFLGEKQSWTCRRTLDREAVRGKGASFGEHCLEEPAQNAKLSVESLRSF